MATKIYKTKVIKLFDGTEIEISPLKIKYLSELMDTFQAIYATETDDDAFLVILECARICMKQFYPQISHNISDVEDMLDMKTLEDLLEVAAGIKINPENEDIKDQASENRSGDSWESLNLAKLEAEVFLLGNWKNFEELESSLCMAELTEIISSKRELDYEEKKFLAAIQGVDLEKNANRGQKEWEDLKARVFSKGKATDSNDILALQGENARKAGFGIGMGLDYEDLR